MSQQLPVDRLKAIAAHRGEVEYSSQQADILRRTDLLGLVCMLFFAAGGLTLLSAAGRMAGLEDFADTTTFWVIFGSIVGLAIRQFFKGRALFGGSRTVLRRSTDPRKAIGTDCMRDALCMVFWPVLLWHIEAQVRREQATARAAGVASANAPAGAADSGGHD